MQLSEMCMGFEVSQAQIQLKHRVSYLICLLETHFLWL